MWPRRLRHSGRPDPDFRPAAEYVRRNTDPEDRLFVWGWFTPLYVHCERKPGTRFVYAQVFVNYRPEYLAREKFRWIADTAVTWVEIPEAWDMLEEDFRLHPPEVLLDTSPGNYNKFGNFPIADFPRLDAIVRDKYRHEATVSGVGIYRLKSERSPTLARPEHVPVSREASVARSRPGRATIGLRIEDSESRQTLPPLSGVTTRPRAAEVVR